MPAILREGSLLQRQAEGRAHYIAIPWGDSDAAAEQLVNQPECQAHIKTGTAAAFDPEDEILKLREMLGIA